MGRCGGIVFRKRFSDETGTGFRSRFDCGRRPFDALPRAGKRANFALEAGAFSPARPGRPGRCLHHLLFDRLGSQRGIQGRRPCRVADLNRARPPQRLLQMVPGAGPACIPSAAHRARLGGILSRAGLSGLLRAALQAERRFWLQPRRAHDFPRLHGLRQGPVERLRWRFGASRPARLRLGCLAMVDTASFRRGPGFRFSTALVSLRPLGPR